jgi:hypothetical protein
MLLSSNSRILTVLFTLAALVFSVQTNAHTLPSPSTHGSHHVFLTRLPRTNKARKYDTFFLNQLPRQATAFLEPRKDAGKSNDI